MNDKTIDRAKILRNYHDHAIIISMLNEEKSFSGMIVDHSPDDHCVFVQDHHLIQYYESREESLLERVYFKDMKAIEYQ